ncbi:MAG: O-antigen ligase family protein [Candidatus Cloacimonetes bacterium]|nr:O-antigen ligase family protein [Candidatus Cloacimonadota bacterium]
MLAIILLNIVILVISPSWAYKTFIHRFQGVFSNPNSLGMFLMISLPIFTYFFLTSNTKFEKGINFTFILLIIILAIFTFSRAAWLGMLVFIMCILYYIKKILFKFTFISSIILLIMLFSSPFMMELLRLSEDPFTYRDRIWQIGLENFSDSKIIGKGFGTTQQIMSNKFVLKRFDVSEYHLGKHFHNIYVEILCETGLIGLLLFALFLISISYKFIKKIKNTQNKEKIFAISIYALFIGVIFHGFFESMLFSSGNVSNIILWSLIGLALQKSNQNTQSFKNIETELLNT